MRRHRWLAVTILLLLGAAALLSLGEREPRAAERREVEFPAAASGAELERRERRATLVLPAPPAAPVAAGGEPGPARRDPFLVALPAGAGDPVVVLEANALRHSHLGELFVGCLLAEEPDLFRRIEQETGIDPLKDVDRVGLAGKTVVVSGFFDRARWSELERGLGPGGRVERSGADGRIYTRADGGATGVWRDQLLVFGGDAAEVRGALERLDGRAPVEEPVLPEALAYGELYGVVPGAFAERLLGRADPELAARLAAAASRIELHVDAMRDVAAVVRVHGAGDAAAADVRDLARSMGAALAVARVRAQATDDRELAELLELASVVPGDGTFAIELALPAARLESWFRDCGRRPPPAPAASGGDAPPAASHPVDDGGGE